MTEADGTIGRPEQPESRHFALYLAMLHRGGSERVMVGIATWLYEHGHRVTFVTTYLGYNEYDVPHARWKRLSDEEAQAAGGRARRVMLPDESIAHIDPTGGDGAKEDDPRGGIHRVFSGLMPEQQSSSRVINLTKRSSLLRTIWETIKPDLILSFIGKNNIMALMTTTSINVPVVVSSRANPSKEYATRQLHLSMVSTFRRAAGVVVQTEDFAAYYPGGIREKTKVIPNAISPEFLRPRFEGERDKTIVAVGNMHGFKNYPLLLKAFARLASKYPDWNVIIYGEGTERKRLSGLVNSLDLRTRVSMPGQVTDVADRIYRAGMYVITSDEEGMPNSLLEAMSLGLPVISTDFAGGAARVLVKDGFNGLLVPTADVGRLETAMVRIMANKGFADALGTKAAEVQKQYHPEIINAEWETYLLRILDPESVPEPDEQQIRKQEAADLWKNLEKRIR